MDDNRYIRKATVWLLALMALAVTACTKNVVPSCQMDAGRECAEQHTVKDYADYDAAYLLAWSHVTPSKAEKIKIRHYLMKTFPQTVEGLYAKAYIAYKNGLVEQEVDDVRVLQKKFSDDPNTLHYLSFMGSVAEKKKTIRQALDAYPEFLNYNFVVRLADFYIENQEELEWKQFNTLIGDYETRLGKDIYAFDRARAMVAVALGEDEKALDYLKSALKKKGGIENGHLWVSYFDAKYASIGNGGEETLEAYASDVAKAFNKIMASDTSERQRNISAYRVFIQFGEWCQEYGHLPMAYRMFLMANHLYFTSENVTRIRNLLAEAGANEDVQSHLKDAVSKLPEDPGVLGLYAIELARTYRYDAAERYFLAALEHSHIALDKQYHTRRYAKHVLYPTYRAREAVARLESLKSSSSLAGNADEGEFALAHFYAGNYDKAKRISSSVKTGKFNAILLGAIQREKAIHAEGEDRRSEAAGGQLAVIPTTSATVDWLVVSPDGKHFIGSDGGSDYWQWALESMAVEDIYEGAILDSDYVVYMTRPVYSPDGRYIAYATKYEGDLGSVLLVYDTREKRFVRQMQMPKISSGLAWSPDGRELAIWNYGRLIKYDFASGEVIKQGEVTEQHGADIMLWTATGKYLVLLERSSKGAIRVYDAHTLKQLHRLEQVNWPHVLGLSADGRYIFSADNQRTLHRWDTQDDFEHTFLDITVLGRMISAHPSKPQLVINDWGGGSQNQLIVIDYERMEYLAHRVTGGDELRIHHVNDGAQLLAANLKKDTLALYDSQTLELIDSYEGESAPLSGGLYAYAKAGRLVSWDSEGLHAWSIDKGIKLHHWKGEYQSIITAPSSPHLLYTLEQHPEDGYTTLQKIDLQRLEATHLGSVPARLDQWSMTQGRLIMAGQPFSAPDKGVYSGYVMNCGVESNDCYAGIIEMVTTPELKTGVLSKSRFKYLAASPDGLHVAVVTSWVDGWRVAETTSEVTSIFEFDMAGKHFVQRAKIHKVGRLAFTDNNTLAIGDDNGTRLYAVATGAPAGTHKGKPVSTLLTGNTVWPRQVEFPDREVFANISKDNRLRIFHTDNNRQILTIIPKRNGEWFAYLPSGLYEASDNGARKVKWRQGENVLPEKRVKELYYRPGIVATELKQQINQE